MPWRIAWRQDLSAKTPAPTGRPPALGFSHRTAPPHRTGPLGTNGKLAPGGTSTDRAFPGRPARQELQVQPISNVTSTSPAHCGQQSALAREIRAWHLWAVD
jgi:hypothetical protein